MRSFVLALSLALALPASAQSPAFFVKDVNVQPSPPLSGLDGSPPTLQVLGDVGVFAASTPEVIHRTWTTDGTEGGTVPLVEDWDGSGPGPNTVYNQSGIVLSRTDGTPEGTVRLAGAGYGPPYKVANVVGPAGAQSSGGFLFSGDDGGGARGLWRTHGMPGDAELIYAFTHPSIVATPNFFREIGGIAYFVANDGVTGRELWRSDGTTAGTWLVVDLAPGSASSLPNELTVIGSELWFTAETAIGRELYKTDGTAAGTVLLKDTRNPGSGEPNTITLAGATVFFVVYGATGPQLWKSDGTEPGTTLVATFPTGGISTNLTELEALGSEVLFDANSAATGIELWKSDGTTTQIVADIWPGSSRGFQGGLLNVGGTVYFEGNGGTGRALWKTDGTAGGTVQVAAVTAFPLGSLDGVTLLFSGSIPTQGKELWRSDGTPAGTMLVKNIGREPASASGILHYHGGAADAAGTLIFEANDGVVVGDQVWRSDGTAAGTFIVTGSVAAGPDYWTVGSQVYFHGVYLAGGSELWRTDGTAAGTARLGGGDPEEGLDLNGLFLFSATSTANGRELWRSDGTEAGTFLVEDLAPGSSPGPPPFPFPPVPHWSSPDEFTKVGSVAFFSALPDPAPPAPRKLFRSDGTAAGTYLVEPPGGLTTPKGLVEIGGLLYFVAIDSLGASRMWRSDGTAAGTVVVPIPLVAGDVPSSPVGLGSALLYIATAPSGNRAVWRTDGTTAGSSILIEIPPSPGGQVANLRRIGSRVVFTAQSPALGGSGLFVTDGTAAGTGPLKTTGTKPGSSTEYLTIGDRLVFSAYDDAGGWEPWVTDGTDAGTRRLADVGPGGDSSTPRSFRQSGDLLYFSAYESRGRELWAIPMSALTLKACEDGWDNDGDGSVDLADPGCGAPTGKTESPQCNDGVDNDGDAAVDLDDPHCAGLAWRKETPGCGLIGIEGAVFAAAVFARRGVLARRRRARAA